MVREAFTLLMVGGVFAGTIWLWRLEAQRRRLASYERYRLRFPQDVGAKTVAHVLGHVIPPSRRCQGLLGADVVSFEVVASDTNIEHFIWLSPHRLDHVRGQLYAAIPGLQLESATASPGVPATVAIELALSTFNRPLRSDDPAAVARSVLAALQPLRRAEELRLQWLVAKAPTDDRSPMSPRRASTARAGSSRA